MVKVSRRNSYWYDIYQNDTLVANVYRGGDSKWRIIANGVLPFDDSTIDDRGYVYFENAINKIAENIREQTQTDDKD